MLRRHSAQQAPCHFEQHKSGRYAIPELLPSTDEYSPLLWSGGSIRTSFNAPVGVEPEPHSIFKFDEQAPTSCYSNGRSCQEESDGDFWKQLLPTARQICLAVDGIKRLARGKKYPVPVLAAEGKIRGGFGQKYAGDKLAFCRENLSSIA